MTQGHGPEQYRLLAVDDHDDCSESIVSAAVHCGYEAFRVADAGTLREAIAHWRPHIIILDLCHPDVDKFEILHSLKAVQFNGQLVIISGQHEWLRSEAIKLATANGLRVAADTAKPVELDCLRELLTKVKGSLYLSHQKRFDDPATATHKNASPYPRGHH
jgi:DNA-binding NtrC family response regulator